MNLNKLLQHCKSVVRGQVEGDRMVAMIALHKNGVKVSDSVVKSVRRQESANENLLRAAFDVFYNYASFIERDRHDKYNDAELYANKLVTTLNQFNGSPIMTVITLVSSFTFKVAGKEFKYLRGKYNAKAAEELYQFLAAGCKDSDALLRVYTELAEKC